MVDIKTDRSYKIEENGAVAIRDDSFRNEAGRLIKRHVEEHNIDKETAEKTLNEEVPKSLNSLDVEIGKVKLEIEEIEAAKQPETYGRYKTFRETYNTKFKLLNDKLEKLNAELRKYKDDVEYFNKQEKKDKLLKQLEEMYQQREDILAWKEQFEGIVKEMK